MKQYTTPEQTAKLILMGMPKPHGTTEHQELVNKVWVTVSETHGDYTIGQLLSFYPHQHHNVFDMSPQSERG